MVVSAAIGAILMAGLTSVIVTSVRGINIATSRIEASSQIRSFQFFAMDDFARSGLPSSAGCTVDSPCTQAILLVGRTRLASYDVIYRWDDARFFLERAAGDSTHRVATGVKNFSWYIDGSPPKQTVVVNLKITVQDYSEFQTLRFYPRLQS
jgi:hypothetical protein